MNVQIWIFEKIREKKNRKGKCTVTNSKGVFPRDNFSLVLCTVREIGLATTDFVRSKQKTIQRGGRGICTDSSSIDYALWYAVQQRNWKRKLCKDSNFCPQSLRNYRSIITKLSCLARHCRVWALLPVFFFNLPILFTFSRVQLTTYFCFVARSVSNDKTKM